MYVGEMATLNAPAQPLNAQQSGTTLMLIAVFKLIKGVLLLAVGIGAFRLLHRDLNETVMHWIDVLRVDPDNRFIHGMLSRVLRVSPQQLRALSAGTFLYAGLLLSEGTGLLLRKKWAEYFTIVTTGLFIPLEVYEIAKHFTAAKTAVLAINVAIVAYLVIRVYRGTRASEPSALSRSI